MMPAALLLSFLSQASSPLFTKPAYIASAGPPTQVMAIDTVGNARGGLFFLDPRGKANLDFQAFSPLGKLCQPTQARTGFLEHTIAEAEGAFEPNERVCMAVLSASGQIRIEHGFEQGKGVFDKDDEGGALASFEPGKGRWQMLPFNSKPSNPADILLVGPNGSLALLANDGTGHFLANSVSGRIRAARVQAADLDGSGISSVLWIDRDGQVFDARIDGSPRLIATRKLVKVQAGSGLAVGHFTDSMHSDVLAGQELLPSGDPSRARILPEIADAAIAKDDAEWLTADLAGDGRDDLIRVRQSQETFTANDIYAQYEPGAAGFCDSSNDGLPDAWKTGAINPGGLNLAAMGCKPGHKDVIVEVQPMWNVSQDHVKAEMKKVRDYFASLKIPDLDGTTGIAMHVIFREPMDKSDDGKGWPELGDKYHPTSHRGITHWMEVYHGGGGQSDIMYDRGSCGDNAMAPVFTHEFGHQLGLDHNGRWKPDGCPIYPSLMNYPYNYQLNGKRENVGFSDGSLVGITLNESHLNKYLPVAPDKIAFIGGPPYRFRMKATPDGKGTLVDWNWDGDFQEKWVKADINYGYGTTAGLRHNVGKTYTTPAPVVCGRGNNARLILAYGDKAEGESDDGKPPSLCDQRPGRLEARVWLGKNPDGQGDDWSTPQELEHGGVTGDPSCASLGGQAWAAYPTVKGIIVRQLSVIYGKIAPGQGFLVPDSMGAQATLCSLGNRLGLCLWRGADKPLGFEVLAAGESASVLVKEASLGFSSEGPVGACEGAQKDGRDTLWIGLTEDQDAKKPNRWQLRQFVVDRDLKLTQMSQEWIGGDQGGERVKGRISVLWEPDKPLGPQGQVYLFAVGAYGDQSPWACSYVTMRIGEKDVNGGWLTRRYYDEWTQSRTGPGVCFFKSDIFYASRWVSPHDPSDNNMFVAFFGRGIQSDPMGDFDDVSYIRDYGLHRSIATLPRE